MNIGYTALKSAVCNRLLAVRKGREEEKKGAWHLGSIVHNVRNMCNKGW